MQRSMSASAVSILLSLLLALLSPLGCLSWTGLPTTFSNSNINNYNINTRQPSSPSSPTPVQRLSALVTPSSAAESKDSYFFVSETASSTSSSSSNEKRQSSELLHSNKNTPPPKSKSSMIQQELDSGRVLEGGQVIDFSSVKASSNAERALAKARQELLEKKSRSPLAASGSGDTILGINEQVIQEVGYELGTFATPQEIQDCAAYLRSRAPPGLLKERQKEANSNGESESSSSSTTSSSRSQSFSVDQVAQFRTILSHAYFEAGEVTGAFAKTFYMGTMLLPPAARQAIWAVYVWCRRTDEIVDAPRHDDSNHDMLLDLSSWELRLENLWQYGEVVDVFDLCLLDCRIQYPTMDITPFMDMIRGMLMDVPGLGQDRYNSFDELHLYCYRVAGTVGLMSLPVFGCAPGYDDGTAREPALSLGVAFQLTNILRDVGEDAVQRGRVYLPQEDLAAFGVTEGQVFSQHVDDNYKKLMQFQIARARRYYERARRGVFMLAPASRLPVQSSLDAYGRILDKIEANGYDSLTKRAYVDKWEKLSILPFSWYRTLDISRIFPLPGDPPVTDRV